MIDENRLKILTDGAKYDVSCSSSGSKRKNTADGLGNAAFAGICHSFAADGRCISLLKILMSNDCVFDCKYCPNRRSADVPRASLTPEEICELTVGFYRRNYIEGLFLSSAVVRNPDYTMELLYKTVLLLRTVYKFNGYIHLKGIPHADKLLTQKAANLVDRMSYNVELPSEESLKLLAPQKTKKSIFTPMGELTAGRAQYLAERKKGGGRVEMKGLGRYLPAGQTTQMIVGASPETDGKILRLTQAMYRKFDLKRVYYSSYIPVVQDPLLPDKTAGLLREHRLYQADWLLRFYGFTSEEILPEDENLPTEYDPKCAWALKNMQFFPVEVNKASVEELLRVPGIGAKGAYKIVSARKHATLTFEHLQKMRIVLKRAKHFITCAGKFFGSDDPETVKFRLMLAERTDSAEQLNLFDQGLLPPADAEKFLLRSTPQNALAVLTGQL
ncbi:MAG: putative DNA modification/repair radical SAM protein [Clostridia bacterium]|nr:putative DNA modification/repair radical SAM protein [Clostridia bacterium]